MAQTLTTSELKSGMVVTGGYWSGPALTVESAGPETDTENGYTHAIRFEGMPKPWRFIPNGQGDDRIWVVKAGQP